MGRRPPAKQPFRRPANVALNLFLGSTRSGGVGAELRAQLEAIVGSLSDEAVEALEDVCAGYLDARADQYDAVKVEDAIRLLEAKVRPLAAGLLALAHGSMFADETLRAEDGSDIPDYANGAAKRYTQDALDNAMRWCEVSIIDASSRASVA